ncbi:Purine-cytosine permease [Pseudonocardia sp. Ae168_Ps1]|uniref:purine-cytosine permease family protein n=1 Tax=unclassified Pseudonocardia TaxID=2619320 RepID=UPI00094A9D3B|nr:MULTISPECIES: cytosine permease [unclassified Pseudonocardia]OLL76064.1 Purine-cytosine permease [Pseudonocardia sp. Ae150A_Ps1]OLL82063.1 Purine-cytosine permease [Pseudonocardia sp. Ae168_Ps1]OLL83824.1 Purine-cytosine permease [Pseudonocardia sp. Ae263_Ps1]OLL90137.1 Purine-cytosine permease [Pseudonocardia sp. Ae356_Ps1]
MATGTTETDAGTAGGALETRGIEPVPVAERHGRPGELFWVWFAANISILGLPLGATLVASGLTVWQAVIAAVLGAVGSFAIVGAVSIAGRRGGAPGLTLSRAVFGVRGNIGPTLVSLLSRLGWETVNTTTAAFALLSLVTIVAGTSPAAKDHPVITIACIAVFVLCTVLVAGLGHGVLVAVQRWATWVFGALNILVGGFLVATVDWTAVAAATPAPTGAVVAAVGVIAAGTGIGWANASADMPRYQSPSVRAGSLVLSAAAGAGIPLVLLISLGSLLAAGDPALAEAGDPVAAIRDLLPAWMAIPYLVAAFGGLLLSNHLSVYSAGLTTLTLGVRLPRVYAVVVDVLVTFAGAIYFMLVADGFYTPFIAFISALAVPITAWVGVFAVDMLRRTHYDPDALMDTGRTSRYWYRAGIEPRATTAWALAIVAGYLFATVGPSSAPWFTGPLAGTWFGENGLAWVITFVVAAGAYALLGGSREPR